MKIAVCSDLHLEFGSVELKNTENADVLILSGDILLASDLNRYQGDTGPYAKVESSAYINNSVFRDFLENVSYEFPTVIYVAGNHEFYKSKWYKTLEILKNCMDDYSNIFFLENDAHVVEDVTFVGCTLWTDMNKSDPLTVHMICAYMNDYSQITYDGQGYYNKLKPTNTIARHHESVNFIRNTVENNRDQKIVVCTHHAPSFKSISEEYVNDTMSNGAYASSLDEIILDNPHIKLWTHGHMHDNFDYTIGETRIVCNPRGYKGYETIAKHFELKYFDI